MDDHLQAWCDDLHAALRQRHVSIPQLADQLDISPRTIYKRLRGEAAWPLNHYLATSQRFGIAPGLRDEASERFAFRREVGPARFDPSHYIDTLYRFSEAFTDVPGLGLRVATNEIPVFYLLSDPTLASLKLYLFEHTQGAGITQVFDADALRVHYAPLLTRAAEISRRYLKIPRQEVWGRAPLSDLLGQLDVLCEARLLNHKARTEVGASLTRVLDELDARARRSRQQPNAEALELRYQRLHTTTPLYQMTAAGKPVRSFATFDSPRYLEAVTPGTKSLLSERFDRTWEVATPLTEQIGDWEHYLGACRLRLARTCEAA